MLTLSRNSRKVTKYLTVVVGRLAVQGVSSVALLCIRLGNPAPSARGLWLLAGRRSLGGERAGGDLQARRVPAKHRGMAEPHLERTDPLQAQAFDCVGPIGRAPGAAVVRRDYPPLGVGAWQIKILIGCFHRQRFPLRVKMAVSAASCKLFSAPARGRGASCPYHQRGGDGSSPAWFRPHRQYGDEPSPPRPALPSHFAGHERGSSFPAALAGSSGAKPASGNSRTGVRNLSCWWSRGKVSH